MSTRNVNLTLKESLVLDEFVNDSTADDPGRQSPFKTKVIEIPILPRQSSMEESYFE